MTWAQTSRPGCRCHPGLPPTWSGKDTRLGWAHTHPAAREGAGVAVGQAWAPVPPLPSRAVVPDVTSRPTSTFPSSESKDVTAHGAEKTP